jgi:hypothetical protein
VRRVHRQPDRAGDLVAEALPVTSLEGRDLPVESNTGARLAKQRGVATTGSRSLRSSKPHRATDDISWWSFDEASPKCANSHFSYYTGDTHFLAYAVGDSPYGPFTYRGHLLSPPVGWTTHHSIVEFQGRWFLYYHDASLSGGVSHRRCVKVQELFYSATGDIVPMDP